MNQAAQIAAKWWADKLRSTPKMDAGDGHTSTLFTIVVSMKTVLGETKIIKFQNSLEDAIKEKMSKHDKIHIAVDYGAEKILRQAALDADIDLGYRLPIKTTMIIRPDEVLVSEGYLADWEKIWSTELKVE